MNKQTHCFRCGARVAPDAEVCPTCGDVLQPHGFADRAPPSQPPTPPEPPPEAPKEVILLAPELPKELSARRFVTIIAAICACALAIGAGLAIHTKVVEKQTIYEAGAPQSPSSAVASSQPDFAPTQPQVAPNPADQPSPTYQPVNQGPPVTWQPQEQTLTVRQEQPQPQDAYPKNLIENGDFSRGNFGFRSSYPYVSPSYNCLWAAGYTVAPVWNNPLLHRLFAAAEYGPQEKRTGNEQVLYANAGGSDLAVIWSANVRCQPDTSYRISFYNISLNGDKAWAPTYEIQVNADRGQPQPAGFGGYVQQSMQWYSGAATTADVSLLKMPMQHSAGLIAISDIKMVKTG